jgi:hypothetical protein
MEAELNTDRWKAGKYREARECGLVKVDGYLYRGLGMRRLYERDPLQGHLSSKWSLTHVGSGHSVAFLHLEEDGAVWLGAMVAELGNWNFGALDGFLDIDPDLPERLVALAQKYPALDLGGETGEQDEELAEECAKTQT